MKDIMLWGFNAGNNLYDTIVLKVSGLDKAKTHNFIFYAGYKLNGVENSVTKFAIGNDTAVVNYYLNATQTDTIYNVVPNAAGEVLISVIGDPNTVRAG